MNKARPPLGWTLTTLETIRRDSSTSVNPSKEPEGSFELYSVPSFESGRAEIRSGKEIGSSKKGVIPGTVLLCKINPRINRVWVVGDQSVHRKIASTEWIPFFPLKEISSNYLKYFLMRSEIRNYLASQASGVGGSLMRVRPMSLAHISFPLAPLAEQHRIVAEIEKHLTRLDAAMAALEHTRVNLKRYRAAVLRSACEGRLVPTEAKLARAEGRDYEPAETLLARIVAERRTKWEADQLAKMKAAGKSPQDGKWKAKYVQPAPPSEEEPSHLPEGWAWAGIGQAFKVSIGATPSRARPAYWDGDIPWVSSGEVAFCLILKTRECITIEGLRNTSTELHPPGTVLLGMIGEGKTRGQAAILGISGCNNQNSAAIEVSEAGLEPEYIYRFFEKQYQQTRRIGSGNNQPALNKSRVEDIAFPLPPLSELHRIVDEVERRLSVVDHLESIADRALIRGERLRQAILRLAFEGRLVPQNPDDEPAADLLARIRAEPASRPDAVGALRRSRSRALAAAAQMKLGEAQE